jgi:hypothetical protein
MVLFGDSDNNEFLELINKYVLFMENWALGASYY